MEDGTIELFIMMYGLFMIMLIGTIGGLIGLWVLLRLWTGFKDTIKYIFGQIFA